MSLSDNNIRVSPTVISIIFIYILKEEKKNKVKERKLNEISIKARTMN